MTTNSITFYVNISTSIAIFNEIRNDKKKRYPFLYFSSKKNIKHFIELFCKLILKEFVLFLIKRLKEV